MTREEAIARIKDHIWIHRYCERNAVKILEALDMVIKSLEQLEIIRCKDCKFYSPMNKKTKTEICNLTMHQNFGDDWFCARAERRADGSN